MGRVGLENVQTVQTSSEESLPNVRVGVPLAHVGIDTDFPGSRCQLGQDSFLQGHCSFVRLAESLFKSELSLT